MKTLEQFSQILSSFCVLPQWTDTDTIIRHVAFVFGVRLV